jgi:prepilin-type N-terminal cleavage/methylation domain-containing protein
MTNFSCLATGSIRRLQKSNLRGKERTSGFTLLEVIVSILIAAILGTIVIQYMSSGLSSSAVSLDNIKGDYTLEQVIEGFTRDYRYWLGNNPGQTITHFKTTYIDTYSNPKVSVLTGSGNTEIFELTGGDNTAGVQVLRVAISDGEQTLYTLFTK